MAIAYRFPKSAERWWQKPLVADKRRPLPAELVVLRSERHDGESGAWLNSSSVTEGVVDLIRDPSGKLKTVRAALPSFVSQRLKQLYEATGLSKGMLDLVIWHSTTAMVRLIEVKSPHWDRPTKEQMVFLSAADRLGIPVTVIEWEFTDE